MASSVLALVVADLTQRSVLEHALRREGFEVSSHSEGATLRSMAKVTLPEAFVLGAEVVEDGSPPLQEWIRRSHPRVPRVLLGGALESPSWEANWGGPFDAVVPAEPGLELVTAVRRAVEASRLARRVRSLERVVDGTAWGGLVGRSSAVRNVADRLDRWAASEVSILLHGEPGTGKGLVARALHSDSGRRDGSLVEVDCAALVEGRWGPVMQGREVGAIAGSIRPGPGALEQAHDGTLFLRSVEELGPSDQEALLKALRERRVTRLGGSSSTPADVRLVAASREPLEERVRDDAFREDLYARLRGAEVRLPSLRERVEDIPLLVDHFVRADAPERAPVRLGREAADRLLAYPWPGNLRELRSVVRRALVTCEDEIAVEDLPPAVRTGASGFGRGLDGDVVPLPPDTLELRALEQWAIRRAVSACGGNMTEAASRLGIGRTTLYRKLDAYGLR